jgi:hypothetical protein
MNERYEQRRADFEHRFRSAVVDPATIERSTSPSGLYDLETAEYVIAGQAARYSRGRLSSVKDGALLADVKRNYSQFWHAWIAHANGSEYLLCGEDYQGQTVVNLTLRAVHNVFPESGHSGDGFCWVAAYPSPDTSLLAVDGCYWGCPYEIVIMDFRTPDQLPYKEIGRFPEIWEWNGWLDNETFEYTRRVDVRKSDGTPCEVLSEAEIEELQGEASGIESRRQLRRFRVPPYDSNAV